MDTSRQRSDIAPRPRRLAISGVVAVLLAVVAASCSTGADSDATTAASEVAGYSEQDDGGAASPSQVNGGDRDVATGGGSTGGGSVVDGFTKGEAGAGGDLASVDVPRAGADRRIVYRASVDSIVDDVTAAVGAARDAVAAEGGFLFGQESSGNWAQVIFKVPTDGFDAAHDAVAAIGTVTSNRVDADDVTEQYVDLESRRATLATSIGRLRGFLAGASSVDEISRLESELTRREAEHDVIAGRLRVLDDQTTFATITMTFTLDPEKVEETATLLAGPDVDNGPPGFGEGLATGWRAVRTGFEAAATVAGFALPFAPLAALLGLLAWGTRARWSRRRVSAPATSPV